MQLPGGLLSRIEGGAETSQLCSAGVVTDMEKSVSEEQRLKAAPEAVEAAGERWDGSCQAVELQGDLVQSLGQRLELLEQRRQVAGPENG